MWNFLIYLLVVVLGNQTPVPYECLGKQSTTEPHLQPFRWEILFRLNPTEAVRGTDSRTSKFLPKLVVNNVVGRGL
jgi:hypothetical protein